MKATESAYTTDEGRWAAVARRDPAADGAFVYCVRTTGVYCRPTCGARRALRENVTFHAGCADAERDGYRACRRCRPDQAGRADRYAAVVEKACRLIQSGDPAPSLDELSAAVGMSRYHFHRVFKAATGVTPKDYAAARRVRRVQDVLPRARTVAEAAFGAGFNSNGRFYAGARDSRGMTPTACRAGGAGEAIRFAVGECSLGSILVAATDKGVCAISIGDDPDALARGLQDRFPRATLAGGDADFERVVAAVVGHVEEPRGALRLPLDVRGTAFQRRVWQALRDIPAGSTASYVEVARRVGTPAAVRAVAGACAANVLAVAIPCHRVVRTDGRLTGYRWGVERKRALLEREKKQPAARGGKIRAGVTPSR
jgi:AraC family transcriptional regulator of adaptative response/methylated-DNA-[protein]-cysteine methyltransferase